MAFNKFINLYTKKNILSGLILLLTFTISSAAPTVTITPPTQTVNVGQKATVKIVTTQATKCTVTGDTYNKNNTLVNGSILLSPTKTSTYIFECTDSAGAATIGTSTVTVSGTQGTNPSQNNNQPTNSPSQNQKPQVQYGSDTIATEANAICTAYSGYQSVYSPVSGGGGGSSVPVDLTQLRPYLISIDKNTQLTANEIRNANMIRFCRELPNMAAASNKLAQDTAKQLKKMADDCVGDERCLLQRVFDADIEREIEIAKEYPLYGREIAKLISEIDLDLTPDYPDYDVEMQEFCNNEWKNRRNPIECISVPTKGEIIKSAYYTAKNEIVKRQSGLATEFALNGGITSTRTCDKTRDNSDPSEVKWYDKNCLVVKKQPLAVNQEILKQVTALPYTQAYSPANILGADQAIDNINTRIRNGNLIDPDISTNFGSVTSGGSNPLGNGGGVVVATNLKEAEANYKKILSNIQVITTLYDATKAAYASSTTVCKVIPAQTRALTLQRVETAKKTYTDYAKALTQKWDEAQKTPNENHLTLVTNINFDLKDKYNQTLINQVYDAVKGLLQACVDAATKSPSS